MITKKTIKIKAKDYHIDIKKSKAYKPEKYNELTQELELDVNEASGGKSWRLVHDGKSVLALFESENVTTTIYNIFEGTEKECEAEIKRLGLIPLPENADLMGLE